MPTALKFIFYGHNRLNLGNLQNHLINLIGTDSTAMLQLGTLLSNEIIQIS